MAENRTHYDVADELAGEGWNFHPRFIRELVGVRDEYGEMTLLHIISGKPPEKTGRQICTYCDGYLNDLACDGYEDRIRDWLHHDVLESYMHATCPECHTPIEETGRARVVESLGADPSPDPSSMPSEMPETKEKTIYKPCECLFEPGEEKIRWDLDKDTLREDVAAGGVVPFYEGPVFKDGRRVSQ